MKRVTLETFLALARLRHFGKTAQQLNTTQSTVSTRIVSLEQDLKVSLFERSPGKVVLTPQGHELLGKAVDVLESMDSLSRAAGIDPYRAGTLRLALSETLAATILPDFIKALETDRPAVNVEISVDSTTGQRTQLLDRQVDLAFLMGPVSEFRIANIGLLDLPMIWVVSADHPLAGKKNVSAELLSHQPIMTYAKNSRPFVELGDALHKAGVVKPRFFSSNALGASLSITQAGLAVSTMPRAYAAPFLQSGSLVEIKVPITLNPLLFTASYRIETGNDLAQSAAELAVDVASNWAKSQSKKLIAGNQ